MRPILSAAAILLSGCAGVIALDTESEDYGPAPRDPDSVIKAYYESITPPNTALRDMKLSPRGRAWVGARLDGPHHGHLWCVSYRLSAPGAPDHTVRDAVVLRNDAVTLRVAIGDWFGRPVCGR